MDLNLLVLKIGVYSKAYERECECETMQPYISACLCPRCGKSYLPGDLALAARSNLSATDLDIHICNECALPDKTSTSLNDFNSWAIADPQFDK